MILNVFDDGVHRQELGLRPDLKKTLYICLKNPTEPQAKRSLSTLRTSA